ncbi:DUF4169 family protein [Cereibacter sphaeroides]|nr:DUF4169 family protein [Cereibacter sphaeroides]
MGDVVNLRLKRKQAARDEARRKGDENAVKHGVPKAVRSLDQARAEKAARELDGHKREPE